MADDLDTRRRRARIRAWRRGMREMDIVMGRFADARLASLEEADLAAFERLLDLPDRDVFGWICGERPPPANGDGRLIEAIRAFHAASPVAR